MKILRAISVVSVTAAIWVVPVTAKAIEALIRSAIMSFGTARNLTDVNIGLAKLILTLSLCILLLVVIRTRD